VFSLTIDGVAQNFKEWLLGQIKSRGWTYESLGNLIGVSHGAVGGWVRGKYLPDPTSLKQLARVTEVKDTWLFRLVGYLEPDTDETAANLDPEIEAMIDKIMRLPDADREELAALLEAKLRRLNSGKGKGDV
jgi:transcriptional regulator with XRE-family HTH domain